MRRLFAASLLCASSLSAQTAAVPTAAAFPDEPYVVTKALTTITVNPDATSTRVITFAAVLRSDAALRQFGVVTVSFASRAEHVDLAYVRVTHPDGTTQETAVADTMEEPAPVTREAPFYSDLKIKELPVKSLHIGDTLEWQAKWTVDHPEVPGQLWGQDTFIRGAVTLDETYELRVPATLHIVTWTNPNPEPGSSFTESTEGTTHLYRWHNTELKPNVGPAAEAFTKAEQTRPRTPAEELNILKGALPSLSWSTFPDWAAVGDWYRTLTAARTTPDAAIRAKVAELTANKATDLEKAQAVYTFVSTQIRYIGVAFGIGRYQPHTAAEIFANQYGDCKDKHTLLASMLSVLNLKAEPVLIGEGIRFDPAVASPAAFNHLITRLHLDGKDILLDSTAEVGPWSALVMAIRDQEALVVPPASPAVLIHTPERLPYPSTETFDVLGSLDKDLTADSKVVLTVRGDDEIVIRSVLRNVSPSNYGAFVQQFMASMGFGGTTSDPAFEHLTDTTQPLQLSFHYHRLKDKDWGDNRITATFQGITLPSFTADSPPVIAIQLGVPRTETSTLEMQLPEGWSAQLPDPVHAHTDFATCDVTWRLDNHKLIAERRLVILKKEVPRADVKRYQAWYDDAGAGSYPYVQLVPPVKPVTTATAPQPMAPKLPAGARLNPSDPHAAELVRKSFDEVKARDLDAARNKLDEAQKINPTEPLLWAGYGNVAVMLGQQTVAMEDAERELSYHPDEVQVYRMLAQLQLQGRDIDAALATLRKWVKAAPADPDAALMLAGQLESAGHHEEAVEEAKGAFARIGSGQGNLAALHLVAAHAQLGLKHNAEAAAEALPFLHTVTDSKLINGFAFVLAQTGSNLDEAESAEAIAITSDESGTLDWTTSEDRRTLLQQQANLAADWDTMGWILYKQGKLPEAFPWVEAALRMSSRPDVREHYATIANAIHTPPAATAAHRSEQELRTFPLGAARRRHGVGGFSLLLGDGKVLASTPQPSDSGLTPTLVGAEDLLKAADLHSLFPPGSHAHLVRAGFVNCYETACELVLAPLSAQ